MKWFKEKISARAEIHQDQYLGKYSFLHKLSYTSSSISKTIIFIPSLSFSSSNILKRSRFGLSVESHLRREELPTPLHITKPGLSIDHFHGQTECLFRSLHMGNWRIGFILFRQGMLLSQANPPLARGNKCNIKKGAETK